MSRIDDKSADRRAQEARLQERRNQDRLQKQRTAEATAFDAALTRQKEAAAPAKDFKKGLLQPKEPRPADPRPGAERAPETAEGLEAMFGAEAEDVRPEQLRHKGHALNEKLEQKKPTTGQEARLEAKEGRGRLEAERLREEKQPDAKSDDIRQDVVSGGSKKGGAVQRQTDGQGGGSGRDSGGGSDKRDQKDGSFRMPPA
ncbi:MAG: hypothetical protein ACK4N5_23330, partial [Myxococcales bacterium]